MRPCPSTPRRRIPCEAHSPRGCSPSGLPDTSCRPPRTSRCGRSWDSLQGRWGQPTRERESQVTPRGNQFLEKCARHPCSEISRALCQGCGARSWALGWSNLVARREKKCLVHFLCNPQAVPPCSSHPRDVSKSCHNYPNCSMIITSSSVAAESHTSLWASHHCNCSSVVLCWPPSSLSLLLT